jgi:hypothetical protein
MADDFERLLSGLSSPATDVFPIAPDDDADLATVTRAIRADTAGDVVCVMLGGETRTLKFAAAETRAIRVSRVKAAGTTATGLEGIV